MGSSQFLGNNLPAPKVVVGSVDVAIPFDRAIFPTARQTKPAGWLVEQEAVLEWMERRIDIGGLQSFEHEVNSTDAQH